MNSFKRKGKVNEVFDKLNPQTVNNAEMLYNGKTILVCFREDISRIFQYCLYEFEILIPSFNAPINSLIKGYLLVKFRWFSRPSSVGLTLYIT